MTRLDRQAGRAYRKARRAGHPAPRYAAVLYRVVEAFLHLGTTADDVRRTLLQIFTAPPPRGRPLIHNGRKYRR